MYQYIIVIKVIVCTCITTTERESMHAQILTEAGQEGVTPLKSPWETKMVYIITVIET